MLRQKISFIVLSLGLALSIACGGGGNDAASVSTSTISGTVNDSDLSAKPNYKTGDDLTAKVTNLDNGKIWKATITDRKYSVLISAGINIKIEVSNGNTVVLSKVLDKASVTAGSVPSIEINAVTHVEAKMVGASYDKNGEMLTSLKAIRKEMFGSEEKPASYALNTIATKLSTDNNFAATVLTYAQMLSSANVNILSELTLLSTNFAVKTRVDFAEKLDKYVREAKTERLDIFSVAQSGATKKGLIPESNFQTLTARFETIRPGFSNLAAKNSIIPPKFGSARDVKRKAAPGTVFHFKFPEAKADGLALSRITYTGSWSGNKPKGITDGVIGNSAVLKFIPSQDDVGKKFKYVATATAPNGKLVTSSVSVEVTNLKIMTGKRLMLDDSDESYYKPTLGPVLAGNYFYIVAKNSTQSKYILQQYKTSDLDGVSLPLHAKAMLPLGFNPSNLLVKGSYAYLTSYNSGLHSINVDSLIADNMTAVMKSFTGTTQMTVSNGKLYTLNAGKVKYSSLRTATETMDFKDLGVLKDFSATNIGTLNDYLYVTNSNSGYFVDKNVNASAVITTFTSSSTIYNDGSGLIGKEVPMYLASYNATDTEEKSPAFVVTDTEGKSPALVAEDRSALMNRKPSSSLNKKMTKLMFDGRSVMISAMTGTSIGSSNNANHAVNGTYLYSTNNNSGVTAYSLQDSSNSATSVVGGDHVSFANSNGLSSFIINKPEGPSTASPDRGGRYYALGQHAMSGTIDYNSSTMTGTWSIQSFKLQASE